MSDSGENPSQPTLRPPAPDIVEPNKPLEHPAPQENPSQPGKPAEKDEEAGKTTGNPANPDTVPTSPKPAPNETEKQVAKDRLPTK